MDEIASGKHPEEGRIPSVRELSSALEVNVNTMMRCFEELSRRGIITNKRGLGYFVCKGAKQRILASRKEHFYKEILPMVFDTMRMLGISLAELADRLKDMARKKGIKQTSQEMYLE